MSELARLGRGKSEDGVSGLGRAKLKTVFYCVVMIPVIWFSVYSCFSYSNWGRFVIPGYSDFSHATELSEKSYWLRGFDVQGEKLVSTSSDPYIRVRGVSPSEIALYINIKALNRSEVFCQVFYANESTVFNEGAVVNCKLKEGVNFIPLPPKEITMLRLDLTNEPGVEIELESVIFNDVNQLPAELLDEVLFINACVDILVYLVMFQYRFCKKALERIKQKWDSIHFTEKTNTCIFVLVVFAFTLPFFRSVWQLRTSVQSTEETYYDPAYAGDTEIVLTSGNIDGVFIPVARNLNSIVINAKLDPESERGDVTYRIFDSGKSMLATGHSTIADDGSILIPTEGLDLQQDQTYFVSVSIASDTGLGIKVHEDGTVRLQQNYPYRSGHILLLISIAAFLAMAGSILICRRRKISEEKVIVLLGVFAGLMAVFVYAPYGMADEYRHFGRVYDISLGNFIVTSYENNVPVAWRPVEYNDMRLLVQRGSELALSQVEGVVFGQKWISDLFAAASGELGRISLVATSGISPLAYFPQVIMVWLARILCLSPLMVFYCSRLGNLLACTLGFSVILKYLPRYKTLFIAVYFLPGNFWCISTCSTDGLLNTSILAVAAFVIYHRYYERDPFTPKKILLLTFLSSLICAAKLPYVVVFLALLLLPGKTIKGGQFVKFMACFLLMTIGILVQLSFYRISEICSSSQVAPAVSSEHLEYFFRHIEECLLLFWRTFKNRVWPMRQVFGQNTGAYCVGLLMISLLSCGSNNARSEMMRDTAKSSLIVRSKSLPGDRQANRLYTTERIEESLFDWKIKALWALGGVSIALAVMYPFFGYVELGTEAAYLWGLQGRYFYPCILPICLALPQVHTGRYEKRIMKYMPVAVACECLVLLTEGLEISWIG